MDAAGANTDRGKQNATKERKSGMRPIRPIILCGGGGTRLWPLSSSLKPKQFLRLASERTMLAQTAERVSDPGLFSQPMAIGSARHEALLQNELPGADLLLEPVGRNSAPAIAAAALRADADELLLVLPADHHITDVQAFLEAVRAARPAAEGGQIVTFGIEPDYPATGYGYIEADKADGPVRRVLRFVEKPNLETAEAYLKAGRFYWNAGIFFFRSETMRAALADHAPDILQAVESALSVDGMLDRARFSSCRSDSIDYAVMEHSKNVVVRPVDMGWSDVGDYRSLHALKTEASLPDRNCTEGLVALSQSQGIIAETTGPRIAVHGMDNCVVVATRDAVLVSALDDAANIKTAVDAAQMAWKSVLTEDQRQALGRWLYDSVLPSWADRAVDHSSGGFVEGLELSGKPLTHHDRRARIAPRQLFSFARAKRFGWNPEGRSDQIIDIAFDFLMTKARTPKGGWAHSFDPEGQINDPRRDLYDHAFVALAATELGASGDARGERLADEVFQTIDEVFLDSTHGGWANPDPVHGRKLANPHMHLLEASLAHYELTSSARSLDRIATIVALFEGKMFDPASSAVLEEFDAAWGRLSGVPVRIEPGHCYEWAFLLQEVERVTGRDTASWARRLIGFAEANGLQSGLVLDQLGDVTPTFRLWPQLERLRVLSRMSDHRVDLTAFYERIEALYLGHLQAFTWVDKLSEDLQPIARFAPASMLYHFMTGIAPFAHSPSMLARNKG